MSDLSAALIAVTLYVLVFMAGWFARGKLVPPTFADASHLLQTLRDGLPYHYECPDPICEYTCDALNLDVLNDLVEEHADECPVHD